MILKFAKLMLLVDRKAKKTAMKSATLQGQKAAIYTRARQYADDLIRDGTSLVFVSLCHV